MGECVNFGIVPNIEYDKDYSFVGGPDAYGAIYAQYRFYSGYAKVKSVLS